MNKETHNKLKKKGWSEEDIGKAEGIIKARYKYDKSRSIPSSNRIVFWTLFAVILIANFFISLTLIPFLLVLNKSGLDFIIVVIGIGFGTLFSFMINITYISRKHHIIAGILIPTVALINFILITYLAEMMNNVLQLTEVRQNPITIAFIYVAAFVVPFILDSLLRKERQ